MTTADESLEDVVDRVDALERDVAALRDKVATAIDRDIPLLKASVRTITAADIDTIEELPDAGTMFHDHVTHLAERVDALDQRVATLRDVGTEKTTKEQKYATILAFAQNKGDATQSKVAITAPEIKGCVGVSRRYAYDLIDAMATEVDGVRLREAKQVETATGTKRKQKALLVDCEAIHRPDGAVNEFTTGGVGRDTN